MKTVQRNLEGESKKAEGTNNLFPVFLKLEEMQVLVVGGGNVALEKLTAIVKNSPKTPVRLVGTVISDAIKELSLEYPTIELHERPFEDDDVHDVDLVMLAIDDKVRSEEIRHIAKAANKMVNAADKPDLCDFYLSSVVQKGNVKIAISTNGKSPTIAKRLKEILNGAIPAEINDVADNLSIIRTRLNGNFAYKVKKLDKLDQGLVENEGAEVERWRKIATYILVAFGFMLLGHFIFSYIPLQLVADKTVSFYETLDKGFLLMILAGFLAQMVDGATSMGYGVTSAIVLMSANISPAAISGSIHTAEIFASGASGYSHYRFGNVNKKMFKVLVIPGVLGAIAGAYLLVEFGETHISYVRPIMACYTLFLGIKIFINAFKGAAIKKKFRHYGWLAGAGGFLDSFGGGGWGPIVTATLITKGRTPRFVVGSVSLTEFFVTVASAFTFFTLIGVKHWQVILGLVIGGLMAAPFAARLQGKCPAKHRLFSWEL
jgi:siroheme synthase-like protein